jgi:hypothetical protein
LIFKENQRVTFSLIYNIVEKSIFNDKFVGNAPGEPLVSSDEPGSGALRINWRKESVAGKILFKTPENHNFD